MMLPTVYLNFTSLEIIRVRGSRIQPLKYQFIKHCSLLLLFFLANFLNAQTVTYTESTEDFPNPDRGFYTYSETKASNYSPLVLNDLVNKRNGYTSSSANYSVKSSLVFRYYVLDDFYQGQNITTTYLNNIQADFSTARQAGVRLILRFTYNITPDKSCGESACPPYLDGTKATILKHIAQLKPILQANEDVIAVVQMGFIGVWGEQYYSTYFGDTSTGGADRYTNQNWTDRNEVLAAVLDAIPTNRMVQVRYPQLKQRFLGGPTAPVTTDAIISSQAHKMTNISRIGLHNDCFLATADDYGTYFDYGNDNSFPMNRIDVLKPYAKSEGKFVAVGGETCDDAFNPQNNCGGQVLSDMASLHYSYLNTDFNNTVNNDWQDGGCMEEIKRKLGYRFVLKNGTYPNAAEVGTTLNFTLNLENVGFSAPFNYRDLLLVFRPIGGGSITKLKVLGTNSDTRFWHTGTINLQGSVQIPNNMTLGNYQLLLHISDPSNNQMVANRPEYSIRLANTNLWDTNTGYNQLNHTIAINANSCSNNNLTLNGALNTSKTYETNGSITSTESITGNGSVVYDAGTEITLNNGFSVASGATFLAFIDGCNSGQLAEKQDLPAPANLTSKAADEFGNKLNLTVSPNPFQGAFIVNYQLPKAGKTALQIYNVLGKLVATPIKGQYRNAGFYQYQSEEVFEQGIYFLVLSVDNEVFIEKIVRK